LSERLEQVTQFSFRGVKAHVTHKKILHYLLPKSIHFLRCEKTLNSARASPWTAHTETPHYHGSNT
jgi:hypothetical protein